MQVQEFEELCTRVHGHGDTRPREVRVDVPPSILIFDFEI